MQYGIRKGFEDVAYELKGIKNVLSSLWHSRYADGETDALNPEAYADEYISTEECGRRLGVSDQTIRNWIAIGRKAPEKGWVEGIHYVNISPDHKRKALIRIPWTALIQSFAKNREIEFKDMSGKENINTELYQTRTFGRLE
jgi:hypothetical protein